MLFFYDLAIGAFALLALVRRHFVRLHFVRLRFWRIAISNAEARTWGVVELAAMALTLACLLRLTAVEGVTAGVVFAVLAYVWTFQEALEDLPNVVQNVARVRDIGERIAADQSQRRPSPDGGLTKPEPTT